MRELLAGDGPIETFLNEYEWRGEGGDHLPTSGELEMMADAMHEFAAISEPSVPGAGAVCEYCDGEGYLLGDQGVEQCLMCQGRHPSPAVKELEAAYFDLQRREWQERPRHAGEITWTVVPPEAGVGGGG